MRNSKGQFVKGERAHPETEFKPGQHWRKHKPFWDEDWLINEYVNKQRSASDIATEFETTPRAIFFWLEKNNIPRRSMHEIRQIKHWGLSGEQNGMYGVCGEQNKNWKGGCTPDRQSLYSSIEWGKVIHSVWKRDGGTCQLCKQNNRKMHIHHIVSFYVRELRGEPSNLVLLCVQCHRWVHSRKNIEHLFIKEVAE
jgi:hypothetical protein